MKKKNTSKSVKHKLPKIELIVAIIGLVGTIIAALISVWGDLAKERILINTTQTAISTVHPINSISTSISPTSTSTAVSFSCDDANPDPYYCEPTVYVSMFYFYEDGTMGGGTIGQISCSDAMKFKSLDSYPGDKNGIGTAWTWAYEDDVTLYINGWDSQYNEIYPKAYPPNILFTYPSVTVIESHPECQQPTTSSTAESGMLQDGLVESSWEDFFYADISQYLCGSTATSALVPESLASFFDTPAGLEKVRNEWDETWAFGPDASSPIDYAITLSNISSNTIWARISNSFQFTVSWVENAPQHANVLINSGGCGGASWRDTDTIVSLSSDFLSTKKKVVFPDADYYTLQPGEGEVFVVPIKCDKPGIYLVDVDIPYSFDAKWSDISLKSSKYVVCPETYSRWYLNPSSSSIIFEDNYTWDNESNSYIISP